VIEVELQCDTLPFAGFETNKVKPTPDTATSILMELIKRKIVGGFRGAKHYPKAVDNSKMSDATTSDDCNYINPDFVRLALQTFLPVLAHVSYLDDWEHREAAQAWFQAVDIFDSYSCKSFDEWFCFQNEAIEKFLSVTSLSSSKEAIVTAYFNLLCLFHKYPWDDGNSRAVQDYKMIHRLIYLLSTKSLFLPSIVEAKKIAAGGVVILKEKVCFDQPNYALLADMGEYYQNEKSVIESWIKQRLSEKKYQENVKIQDGFLVRSPILVEFSADGFVDGVLINLLRIVLEAFEQRNDYFSLGQVYIGVCHYCGQIMVRSSNKQRFCSEKTKRCRQHYSAIIQGN